MKKSPILTDAQKAEVLGDNLYLITPEGININGALVWAKWMATRQGEKVVVDQSGPGQVCYVFDATGKKFLGAATYRIIPEAQKVKEPIVSRIMRQGILITPKDLAAFYIYEPWMEGMSGVLVFCRRDDADSGLYYVFSACSKSLLGTARRVTVAPLVLKSEKTRAIRDLHIECLTEICHRRADIIERLSEMNQRLERQLFLALNRIHPTQRKHK